jgi:hypothetical protein
MDLNNWRTSTPPEQHSPKQAINHKITNRATQPLALLAHIADQMDPWAIKYTDSPSIPTCIWMPGHITIWHPRLCCQLWHTKPSMVRTVSIGFGIATPEHVQTVITATRSLQAPKSPVEVTSHTENLIMLAFILCVSSIFNYISQVLSKQGQWQPHQEK